MAASLPDPPGGPDAFAESTIRLRPRETRSLGTLHHREVMPVFTATRMAPGLVLPAYFDPEDPADFILVW